MRQPIVKNLRTKTKAKDLTSKAKAKAKAKDWTSKAKDFIKCPRGASRPRPRPRRLHHCLTSHPSHVLLLMRFLSFCLSLVTLIMI